MLLEPKKSILNLDAYKPNFGSSNLKKLIRLSANENALGYSPKIYKELKIKVLTGTLHNIVKNLLKQLVKSKI